jgi:hypothetical protein
VSNRQIDLVLNPARVGEVWKDRAHLAAVSHINAVAAGDDEVAVAALERFLEATDMMQRARKALA